MNNIGIQLSPAISSTYRYLLLTYLLKVTYRDVSDHLYIIFSHHFSGLPAISNESSLLKEHLRNG